MAMSTQTLVEGSRLLARLLVDEVQIMNVGEPVTVGFEVTRPLTPVGDPVPGLVQSISMENTIEGFTSSAWSVKVPWGTDLQAGQAVKVLRCVREPRLQDTVYLIDKISENGLSMIRKGVATTFRSVNQEGKEGLA